MEEELSKNMQKLHLSLEMAIRYRQQERVRELLDQGCTVNVTPKHDAASLLCLALKLRTEQIALELLKQPDVDLEKANPDSGMRAIHLATVHGFAKVVERLLELGCEIDPTTKQGNTPLHYALFHSYEDIALILLVAGASQAIGRGMTMYGLSPIHMAVQKKLSGVVKHLKSSINKVSGSTLQGATPLMVAITDRPEMVPLLLELGADPNGQNYLGDTALHLSARSNDLNTTALLLAAGADPNSANQPGTHTFGFDEPSASPLHEAVMVGNMNLIKLLTEHGADLNSVDHQGYTPLFLAMCKNKGEIALYFINEGPTRGLKVNKLTNCGQTLLYGLVGVDEPSEMAEKLIALGLSVRYVDRQGVSILSHSILYQCLGMTKILLEHGADPNECSVRPYCYPLIASIQEDFVEATALLIKHGADIQKYAIDGSTPLEEALRQQSYCVAKALMLLYCRVTKQALRKMPDEFCDLAMSRYRKVPPLQHFARLQVRKSVHPRYHRLTVLRIPKSLIAYLQFEELDNVIREKWSFEVPPGLL